MPDLCTLEEVNSRRTGDCESHKNSRNPGEEHSEGSKRSEKKNPTNISGGGLYFEAICEKSQT